MGVAVLGISESHALRRLRACHPLRDAPLPLPHFHAGFDPVAGMKHYRIAFR
jgi:hypothetical protein